MENFTRAKEEPMSLAPFTFTCQKKGKVNTAFKTRFFHFSPAEAQLKYWAKEADCKCNKKPKGVVKVVDAVEKIEEKGSSNHRKIDEDKKKNNSLATFLGAKHVLFLTDETGRIFILQE
jgi:hypothetical protein